MIRIHVWLCTITNTRLGTITVHKNIDIGLAHPIEFYFTLSPDPGNGEVCATDNVSPSGDAVFEDVPSRYSAPVRMLLLFHGLRLTPRKLDSFC